MLTQAPQKNSILLLLFLFPIFIINSQNLDQLPSAALPSSFSTTIRYQEQEMILELEKTPVFGPNTRFLVDDGTGKLVEINKGTESAYVGNVKGLPGSSVNAVLTKEGLMATIKRQGFETIEIQPNPINKDNYYIKTSEKNVTQTHHCGNDHTHEIKTRSSSSSKKERSISISIPKNSVTINNRYSFKQAINTKVLSASNATLPPTKVMQTRQYEIGVEIGSRAFEASSAYNKNLSAAQAAAQSIIGNLNTRYLRAAGIQYKLGTVIIRTNPSTDPLRNSVTGTGTSSTARSSLEAFRNYWNNNPDEVGNTHDLAIYHVLSAPSGLAYVNQVGTSLRYATSGGNGPTSWADGTATHEIGHLWNLRHTNSSGYFYEHRPRVNSGATTSGGNQYRISIMSGKGTENIKRMATQEANVVLAARSGSIQQAAGDLITPAPTNPFGVVDNITLTSATKPTLIDVIANDYDINNEVLDVSLMDKVSFKGGTISISDSTGPGGRNQISYTPPNGGLKEEDFFHYTVFDPTGRTNFGTVYVLPSKEIIVDLNTTKYNYDLGPSDAPVLEGFTSISDKTYGDINWTGNVNAVDRGQSQGVNAINRDFISSSEKATFNHKLKNGIWNIHMNMGDSGFSRDNMSVTIESEVVNADVDSEQKVFTRVDQNITVRDGELNIEVQDNGGNSQLWVWNRLTLTYIGPAKEVITVDLNATRYDYDMGTSDSPVFTGYTRITEHITGDVTWSGGEVTSRDRGDASGVNANNRDLVFSSQRTTLNHKITNGDWRIKMNMGDMNVGHDNMSVKAEGIVINADVDSEKGVFSEVNKVVTVTDGELNIEIADNGGVDVNWVWNRLTLIKESTLSIGDNANKNKYIRLASNPVKEYLQLIIPTETIGSPLGIVIYNSLGKLVFQNQLTDKTQIVDVSYLQTGIYFLKVNNTQNVLQTIKFVK